MIDMQRVLCPVDFSGPSRHALAHGAAVAAWYKARLVVLHVRGAAPSYGVAASFGGGKDVPASPADAGAEGMLALLRRFVGPVADRPQVDLLVADAPDARSEIVEQADALNADLLVMGAHGRSGVERLLLGSVTERVLRLSRCPVLVVPHHAADPHPDGAPPFSQILCAIDFSSGSTYALSCALDLAQDAAAHLTLLHAIEMPPELREVPVHGEVNVDAVRAAAEAACLQRLRSLVPAASRDRCTVHTAVVEGRAQREILKQAEARGADLIVMGVQGRGALDLLLFGSNTHAVILGSRCPVLAVRGK